MATAFKQVKNNSKSTLAGAITNSATSLTVQTGHGVRFPSTGNSFWATIWNKAIFPDPRDDPSGEIVLVAASAGDTFTITRGQLGSTGLAHASGDAFEMLLLDQHFKDVYNSINTVEDTYINDERGDARYAGQPYAVMAKAKFASLASSYGMLGKIFGNSGYLNDLKVYGESTQASTPTPDVPVPIVSSTGNQTVRSDSKNLIALSGTTTTVSGITTTHNADGSVTLNGTATGTTFPDISAANPIAIYAGMQLTLSAGVVMPTGVNMVLRQTNPNLVYLNVIAGTSSATGVIGSTASGLAYAFIQVLSGTVLNNLVVRPQIEVGGVVTSFEKNSRSTQTLPLGTTQLRSLPNGVSDRIYKSGSSWYLEQNVGSNTITGAGFPITLTNGTQFVVPVTPEAKGGTDTLVEVSSNRFNGIKRSDRETIANSVYSFPGQPTLRINTTIATDTTGINAWLATNQPIVQYILATPITTTVTDPALITALENIRTYQGITNITASTPVSGSYGTNMVTVLNSKLDKTTQTSRVYGTDTSGNQAAYLWDFSNTANTFPRRDGSGRISVGDATSNEHSVSLSQLNTRIRQGTGFPNGVVSAPVGSIYIDTAVTNGASSWIKKSGAGNTGWTVLEGDTGWRDVSALIPPVSTTGGILKIRRINTDIYLQADNLYLTSTSALTLIADIGVDLGASFRPVENLSVIVSIGSGNTIARSITFRPVSTTAGITHLGEISSRYWASSYYTTQAWPTTLPGTAA